MTPSDKEQIRSEYRVIHNGKHLVAANVRELATRYNCSQQTIREIAKGKK